MAALRAWLRRNLAQSPAACPLTPEHELDWLAMTLGRHPQAPFLHPPKSDSSNLHWNIVTLQHVKSIGRLKEHAAGSKAGPHGDCCGHSPNAHRVMMLRQDLGELAGWHGPASAEAISVALSIEKAMDYFFVRPGSQKDFTWSLGALWSGQDDCESIHFHITRREGAWKAYADEIEAALSLWLYSVDRQEKHEAGRHQRGSLAGESTGNDPKLPRDAWLRKGTPEKPSLQVLGPRKASLQQNLQLWMPDDAVTVVEVETAGSGESTNGGKTIEAHRVFGFVSDAQPLALSDNKVVQYEQRTPPTLDKMYDEFYLGGDNSDDSDLDSDENFSEDSSEKSSEDSSKDSSEDHTGGDSNSSDASSYGEDLPRPENKFLGIESYKPLRSLYAQHLFSAFVWAAAKVMGVR